MENCIEQNENNKELPEQDLNQHRPAQWWCFMIARDDILSEIEKELDDLFAEAPRTLSEEALKMIREESIGSVKQVLAALTTREMQSAGAYNRFLENTLAQARMRMHERRR